MQIAEVKEVSRSRYSVTYSARVDGVEVKVGGHADWTRAQFVEYLRSKEALAVAWREVLTADETGQIAAPALPDPASVKAARKALAEGRKALRVERERQNALRNITSATADVQRAEEYAARLEDEAREAIARAEELTEAECDEAVILAKRVRDLRRLRRAVEQAAEDPQVNTPEFFEWLTEEHRATYAQAFTKHEKAKERQENFNPPYSYATWKKNSATSKRFATQTEKARAVLSDTLRAAFTDHARADVLEIGAVTPEEVERDGEGMAYCRASERVFGRKYRPSFDIIAQVTKRELRRLAWRIPQARESIAEARAEAHAALLEYAPRVREDERTRYAELLASYETNAGGATLARAA